MPTSTLRVRVARDPARAAITCSQTPDRRIHLHPFEIAHPFIQTPIPAKSLKQIWLGRVEDHRTSDGLAQLVPNDEMVAEAGPTNAAARRLWLWREDSNLRPPD
jgi:hypothetical protein